jgi:predicted RNase H-like HicB family nuclease
MKRKLTRVIQKHDGWYIGYVKEIPGVNTQGRTRRSARRNLKEALALTLEAKREFRRFVVRVRSTTMPRHSERSGPAFSFARFLGDGLRREESLFDLVDIRGVAQHCLAFHQPPYFPSL